MVCDPNGTRESSITDTIIFMVSNGSYIYTVNSVTGYTVINGSGTLTIAGGNVELNVTFRASSGIPINPDLLTLTFAIILVAAVLTLAAIRKKGRR